MSVRDDVIELIVVDQEGECHRVCGRQSYKMLLLICDIWWDCWIVVTYDSGMISDWLPAIGNPTEAQRRVISKLKKEKISI